MRAISMPSSVPPTRRDYITPSSDTTQPLGPPRVRVFLDTFNVLCTLCMDVQLCGVLGRTSPVLLPPPSLLQSQCFCVTSARSDFLSDTHSGCALTVRIPQAVDRWLLMSALALARLRKSCLHITIGSLDLISVLLCLRMRFNCVRWIASGTMFSSSLVANVEYRVSGAEKMAGITDHSVDLVAVAQAAQYVGYATEDRGCPNAAQLVRHTAVHHRVQARAQAHRHARYGNSLISP